MLSRRIPCHSCGQHSRYLRSSATREFRCSYCQAYNFLDKEGNYADPPQAHVQKPHTPQHSSIRSHTPAPQQSFVFCSTCLQNQQIYNEALANYLPDEDHPQYAKYEKELPAYRQKLEQRYPQICKKCAPRAQATIHDADYYSMTNNAQRLINNSRATRRSASPGPGQGRDSAYKLAMRISLNLAGMTEFACFLYQIVWHAHRVLSLRAEGVVFSEAVDDLAWQDDTLLPKASQCLEQASRSVFTSACSRLVASSLTATLLVSAALLWYNPELKKLYSAQVRYATIKGWRPHLLLTAFGLVIRLISFRILSRPQPDMEILHQIAAHGFTILLMLAVRFLAQSTVSAKRWRVQGSIMPKPEERDVLGYLAGPAQNKSTPYASPTAPSVLLREQEPRFPIQNLSRHRPRNRATPGGVMPPSPPHSDHGDPMDIEPASFSQQTAFVAPGSGRTNQGWEGLRTNILSMDDELRAKQEQQRGKTQAAGWLRSDTSNPFRGTLPPAPSSFEKRLRNPVSQMPRFKEQPVTERQDFLNQMRAGIDKGRGFTRALSVDTEASDMTTDARSRTRGFLELDQSSNWHLPSDAARDTGLEDAFGGSFKIQDINEVNNVAKPGVAASKTALQPGVLLGAAAAVLAMLIGSFVLDVGGLRRSICLFLISRLESLGY